MKFRNLSLFMSLLIICLIAVTATWVGVREFKNNLLKEEAINEAIRWAEFVASKSGTLAQEVEDGKILQPTRNALDTAMDFGIIIRYKIFNSQGLIVYASNSKDIGQVNVKPYFKQLATDGKIFARIAIEDKYGTKNQVVGEAYFPLILGGKFSGAIEVYVDQTFKASEFDRLTRYVFWGVSALVIGVVLSWAFFVGRDLRIRTRLENELSAHRDHLQERVESATRKLRSKATELEKALSKQKELNQLQRQFVSMASHEFRTPLTIIDGAAQRIKNKMEKDTFSQQDTLNRVDKIRKAVERMARLMESTLNVARLQEGKVTIEVVPCNIGKVITEACVRQQECDKTHNISFELIDLPDFIQADTEALNVILNNLLSNAVKYTREIPEVELKVFQEGAQIVISVRDYGIGIDEEDLQFIGERFFRAKSSTGIAGTGIGLNLVKMLVGMHQGTLSVESIKGQGSIFTIRLPIAGPQQFNQTDERLSA